MANLDQVIAQIRFQLDQLSIKNAHHEFEHLCRHLTRARICSNILPATGPVSAGGDQGRDFETFRTYLSTTSIADATFIGLASHNPIAFACSLEKGKRISGKIRSDVQTIVSSGSSVDAIHYFCTADVTVAGRHKLKSWVRKSFSMELEIHDGHSISELLSGRDVFWIAERYLNVPGEIYPRSQGEDGGEWYQEALSRWKTEEPAMNNYAHFANIKAGCRHALDSNELKQDVPFWIGILEKYVKGGVGQLRHRAIYEVAVVSLKGLGTLSGNETSLRQYYARTHELDDPTSLKDAALLLNYCIGSIWHHTSTLTAEETSAWLRGLTQKVEQQLEADNVPNSECLLLDIRGYLYLSIDPLSPQPPNAVQAVECWLKMAEIIKDAPLFPLDKFADNLTQLIEITEVPESYFDLTEQIDRLLSKRIGGFAAAQKSRDRAVALYQQGRILASLELLHRSKIKWFAAETLREALLTMLFISKCYFELGLVFASKYYALAVAFIAVYNSRFAVRSFISRGLLQAALCDYLQGAVCGFLNITQAGLWLHFRHAKDAGDLNTNKELQSMLFHIVTLRAVSERVAPQFESVLNGKIKKWSVPKEWNDELLPTARETWGTMSDAEMGQYLATEMYGTPFSDLGATREVVWSELGITWKVIWANDYETTKEAEQFIAVLQILLADAGEIDLCLLKTTVEITLDVSNVRESETESLPSNKGRIWRVTLPRLAKHADVEFSHSNVFIAVSEILFEISLLPERLYWQEIEKLYRKGLTSKIFVAQSYGALYQEFINKEEFDSLSRASLDKVEATHPLQIFEHEELGWKDALGPGYSQEQAEEILRNRYINVIPPIRFTLEWLKRNAEVMKVIQNLREKGWLDWHILSAIASTTTNYRLNQRRNGPSSLAALDKIFQELRDEKVAWEPVPPDQYSEEELIKQLRMSMTSTLQLFGLECHQRTPDMEAIDHFLRFRYNYWKDDIEHNNFFELTP